MLVEANPKLVEELRAGPFHDIVPAALSAGDGNAEFFIRENLESGSIFHRRGDPDRRTIAVDVVSLETLAKRLCLGSIDVLKLDVEGAEFDILRDMPADLLGGVGQITVEFHDFLPDFAGRGLFEEARRRLERIGFAWCPISLHTNGDVLFLNRRRFHIADHSATWLAVTAACLVKMREIAAA